MEFMFFLFGKFWQMWILHNMGAQCGRYNHRQRDHVAMAEHLAGSSALSGVCWLRLSLLLLHRASSALVILSFSQLLSVSPSPRLSSSRQRGPQLLPECFLSLCLRGAEELYQLGKKASLLQPDNPPWVWTIAPSLFVKHFDTLRACACFWHWRARVITPGPSTLNDRWLHRDLIEPTLTALECSAGSSLKRRG